MSLHKNLIKHSFVYSISGLLFKASNLILLPVYTRVLTADEIGTIALLATFFGLFKTVVYLGHKQAYLENIYEAKSDEEKLVVISLGIGDY